MKKYVTYSPDEILFFCEDPKDKIVYSILDLDKTEIELVEQFCSDLSYDHSKAYTILAKNGVISKEFASLKLAMLIQDLQKELDKLLEG